MIGNRHADRVTGLAARYAQLPNDKVDEAILATSNSKGIQLRIATIIMHLPPEKRTISPHPTPQTYNRRVGRQQ